MSGRILFADIGNTMVKWRLWNGGWGDLWWTEPPEAPEKAEVCVRQWKCAALVSVASAPIRAILDAYCDLRYGAPQPSAKKVSEGVLALAVQLAQATARASVPFLLAGRDFAIPMPTDYEDPKEIGADRLCAALAGREIFGAPVVTASAGTCITVEAVDGRGVLIGGAIAAGVGAMAKGIGQAVPHLRESLGAALFAVPTAGAVGRSTAQNLALGLWLGAAGILDRLIAAARAAVGSEAPVILTGGDAHRLAPLCETKVEVFDHLVLDGLRFAYEAYIAQGPE